MRGARAAPDLDDDTATKVQDDAALFEMDEVSLAHLREAMRAEDDDVCEVWLQHWDIVQAFIAVDTQWRAVVGGGGFAPSRMVFIGLDYAGVRAGLDAEGIEVTPDLWRGLRVMEAAACAALNEVN